MSQQNENEWRDTTSHTKVLADFVEASFKECVGNDENKTGFSVEETECLNNQIEKILGNK